ncbi:MAG: aspartate aminotransferase family protein [Burkholderiaceae bacterium]
MPNAAADAPQADFSSAQIARFFAAESHRFRATHPRCAALHAQAQRHFLFGVPMHWMADTPAPFPLFVDAAQGARLVDADGHEIIDFCLGDTGAMFGHSPAPIARTLAEFGAQGATTMLPSAVALEVAALLEARFGLPMWQFTATASDANRFLLRWARAITGRPCILVFNGCYHGTVDDTFVDLAEGGGTRMRASLLGQVHDLTPTTRVVEFNDSAALEAALAPGDVACVLTEPVLTNVGMVLPEPGFLQTLRALTRRHGTLLAFDETHTISCGPGGYTRADGLPDPDMLVLGKPIAGGTPGAAYGFSAEVGARMQAVKAAAAPGHSGIGTTLSAGLLTLRLMRTMLAEVMDEPAYARMFATATRVAEGLQAQIAARALPWSVTRIGARCEVQFRPTPPRNGSEARAAFRHDLEAALQLALLNRGVLLTPFHNMVLACPAHTAQDADTLVAAFADALDGLAGA